MGAKTRGSELTLANAVRWILVLPVAYLGYYAALISGMAFLALAEYFCPPEAVISGMCVAGYMKFIERILFVVFPGIAAVLVVLLPVLVAPSRKVEVAFACLAIGSVIAIIMGTLLQEWVTLGFTLLCGTVTAGAVYRYLGTNSK